jgi:quinol monooxygenase YgiN
MADDNCCSIVPYFEVPEENMAMFRKLTEQFVEKTRSEPGCLYYGFTFNGNTVHCREGYADAEALRIHLENVGDLLAEAQDIASLDRLEIHGPEAQLAKLYKPLSALNVTFFVLENGFRR